MAFALSFFVLLCFSLISSDCVCDKINIKNVGTKKLKDYFIDKKIPREYRDSIPLITLGEDVLWVLDDFNTVNNNYLINTEHKLVIILMEANNGRFQN